MRTDYLQIPSVVELSKTLQREIKRGIPPSKQSRHFASIAPLSSFLESIGYDNFQFELNLHWAEVLVKGDILVKELIPFILSLGDFKISDVAVRLYRYLSEEDPSPELSDLIIAFGSKTNYRAEKAVELFHKGVAPKLLFSGKGSSFTDVVDETEADRYTNFAIRLGVPKEAIIIENEAITLPDNVRRSLNLLDELRFYYKKVILINSPYSQRRAWGYFMKYCPEGITAYRINCKTKDNLQEDTWFKNEEGIKYVLGEYIKIWMSLATNTI